MASIKNIINEEINNLLNGGQARIVITPREPDYRSGKQDLQWYDASYEIEVNGQPIEITGTLKPHHTGRSVEYGFEPGYFNDSTSESYWDENWETIEDAIRNEFYSQKY